MNHPKLPRARKFPASKQRRMDELLEKNSHHSLTLRERQRLETLVGEAEELAIANGKRLAEFVNSQSPNAPVQGVPVTVWVNPDLAET